VLEAGVLAGALTAPAPPATRINPAQVAGNLLRRMMPPPKGRHYSVWYDHLQAAWLAKNSRRSQPLWGTSHWRRHGHT